MVHTSFHYARWRPPLDGAGGQAHCSASGVNTEQELLTWFTPASIILVGDVLSMVLVIECTVLRGVSIQSKGC